MSYIGTNKLGTMYLGDTKIGKAYLGSDLVFDSAGGGQVLPSGYSQLEYVSSSNPASIVTNVSALGSKWELDLQDSVTTSSNQVFICSNSNGGCFAAVNSGGNFALGASNIMTSASTRTTVGIEFIDKGMIMTIGGNNTQRVGTHAHDQYVSLLGHNNNYVYQGKIYGIKCVSGGSFEGVPAQRISDGVYGIYDVANDVFYSGNFTGA